MNTKTSSNKFKALVLNDMKKYWVFSLALFSYLFLGKCVPVILKLNDTEWLKDILAQLSNFQSFADITASFAAPVMASLLVFRYLHTVSSVSVCHSLPVSRKQHYLAHSLSGYALCAVPVLASQAVMTVIALACGEKSSAASFVLTTMFMLTVMLVTFSVSNIAAMLCGTSLMHAIGAVVFNVLPASIVYFIMMYCSIFLTGFTLDGTPFRSILSAVFPVLRFAGFSRVPALLAYALCCIAVSAAFSCLGYLLYRNRKLECASDPLCYRKVTPLFLFIMTFTLATVTALMFTVIDMFMAGLIAGFIVFFIFSAMLVTKTVRIFNMRMLKYFVTFSVITAVFVSVFAFDITGYEDRQPDPAKAEWASADIFSDGLAGSGEEFRYCESSYTGAQDDALVFESREAMEYIAGISRELADISDKKGITFDLTFNEGSTVKFSYGRRSYARSYNRYDFSGNSINSASDNVKGLFECNEFKEKYRPSQVYELKTSPARTNVEIMSLTDTVKVLSYGEYDDLLAAMDMDFEERTFEEELMNTPVTQTAGYIAIGYRNRVTFAVRATDRHTISWLMENGCWEDMNPDNLVLYRAEGIVYGMHELSGKSGICTEEVKKIPLEQLLSYGSDMYGDDTPYLEIMLTFRNRNTGSEYMTGVSIPVSRVTFMDRIDWKDDIMAKD